MSGELFRDPWALCDCPQLPYDKTFPGAKPLDSIVFSEPSCIVDKIALSNSETRCPKDQDLDIATGKEVVG